MINRFRSRVSKRLRSDLAGSTSVLSRTPSGDALPRWSDNATLDDLYYCFRLFLGREPEPDGWEFWKGCVERGMPVHRLAEDFLGSREFRVRRLALHKPIPIELSDFKMYIRQGDWSVGVHIARDLAYEPHVTREMRTVLSKGDVVIDIGANIGYFTLLAASMVGDLGKVIAFEPNPPNCELIQLSLRANDFHNILVYQAAVLDEAQAVALEVEGSNAGIAHGIEEGDLVVEAVVLDTLLQDESRINVIKMDIEGAEARALRGMMSLVRKHRPVIFTEFFPVQLKDKSHVPPEDYLGDLQSLGYDLFILHRNGERTSRPQTSEQIMTCWRQGIDGEYLDLVAYPHS